VSCLDLAGVLDAASGFTDALPGEDDIERLLRLSRSVWNLRWRSPA
jgi:hypothetical protein